MQKNRTIKIFGERNTGTHALIQMLDNADGVHLQKSERPNRKHKKDWLEMREAVDKFYHDDWNKLYVEALNSTNHTLNDPTQAWEHSAPDWDIQYLKQKIDVVFMVSNPYSWVISTACKPRYVQGERTADFAEFLTRPWLTERRDNTSVVLPSILDLWTTKITAYMDFADMAKQFNLTAKFVKFENFIENPKDAVYQTLNELGHDISGVFNIEKVNEKSNKQLSELQHYHREELWKNRLTKQYVELVNERMDWELVERLGYEKLSPSDFPDKLSDYESRLFSYEMMAFDPTPKWEIPSNRKTSPTTTA